VEIAGLPGIGPRVASAVLAALRPEPAAGQEGNRDGAQNGIDRGEQDGHDNGQGNGQEHDQGAEGGRREARS
jgi:hypothetical protein